MLTSTPTHHPFDVSGDFGFDFEPFFCAGIIDFLFPFNLGPPDDPDTFFYGPAGGIGVPLPESPEQRFNLGSESLTPLMIDISSVLPESLSILRSVLPQVQVRGKAGNVLGPVSQHGMARR